MWKHWHRRDRRVERGILGDLKGLLGGGYNVKRRDGTGSLAFNFCDWAKIRKTFYSKTW